MHGRDTVVESGRVGLNGDALVEFGGKVKWDSGRVSSAVSVT